MLRRREIVARLRAQRRTVREIVEQLAAHDPPILVSTATVDRDLQVIRKEWQERASDNVQTWVAAELQVLHQLERDAWDAGLLQVVLRCLERRAKYLGLDKQQDVRSLNVDLSALTNEQLGRLAAGEDLLRVLAEALPKPAQEPAP